MRAAALAVIAAWSLSAAAQEFTIKDIRVEGISRTEAGTVFSYLPVRVGDRYDAERGVAAIRALYATGLFKDVRLEIDGDVLVVVVEERPAIAALELSGVKEFEVDAVTKSLREVGLAEGRILDRALLERAEQELKRQYLSRGYYAVTVKTTVTPIERNRVNVVIAVDEGEAARIQRIAFTGNKVFSESTLRGQMELTTPGWLTWYNKRDQYSRQKLQADLEKIRSYYLNRGYLDFNIESTQVTISPSKEDVSITINLNEGERYTIASVKLAGELLGLDAELDPLVDIKPGSVYNAEEINVVGKRITDRFSTLGYAFATANPVPEADREKRIVDLTILVDPGRRVYVRRVNVTGNSRTRDDVIRREVRQYEATWLDSDKVRLSRDRIDRLGYFEKVELETPPVPGTNDQVDVNINVKERSTGTISAGLGYSTTDGVVLTGKFAQTNAFGSGETVSFEINTSRANTIVALTHTDPYATLDGISRTTDVYWRKSNLAQLNLGTVDFESLGASMRFGVPFTEFDTVFFGLGVEATKIGIVPCDPLNPALACSPPTYTNYVNQFGTQPNTLLGTIGWARDSRDNLLVPTRGRLVSANGEIGLPGLDVQYYRAVLQAQQYIPIASWLSAGLYGYIGYGNGYNGDPYPVFKNFYAGGIGSVRGWESQSLGPRDALGTPLGGNQRFNATAELLMPLPGADRTFRGFVFSDTGWVWGPDQNPSFSDLRYSVGVGVAWLSPVGPLRLAYARPMNAKPGDQTQNFQFQIGTGF
ncbi:MAG: outer membrane protein assembly factor BamA [Burkholderiales bacterium]|jgi:outer membrane protein insertion porin family|nr:outer membrane protein assembly factor BamA [Burkholderiales bacterium]